MIWVNMQEIYWCQASPSITAWKNIQKIHKNSLWHTTTYEMWCHLLDPQMSNETQRGMSSCYCTANLSINNTKSYLCPNMFVACLIKWLHFTASLQLICWGVYLVICCMISKQTLSLDMWNVNQKSDSGF